MDRQSPQSKEARITQIVKAQLGSLDKWEKPKIRKTVGPYDTTSFEEYYNAIEAIRSELFKNYRELSLDELNRNFDPNGYYESSEVRDAEIEANQYLGEKIDRLSGRSPSWIAGGFGNPEYFADFEYWGKMSKYSLHEALMLSVGIEPKHVGEIKLDEIAKKVDKGRLYPAFEFLVRRRELFRRYFPTGYSGWLSIPRAELKQWIDEIELEIHTDFYNELEKQHPKVNPKDFSQQPKKFTNQERETLLKLVAAMAIQGYVFNPNKGKNDATSDIVGDLDRVGLSLDSKTVLKWLREATSLVPKEYWRE